MQLRIPTIAEIMDVSRSRGMKSEAPHLWNGLAGWWPMQEGGGETAFDASGYGNHGTLTNMDPGTDWVVTEKGWALDFDGSDDRVVASNIAIGTQDVCVSGWCYLTPDAPLYACLCGCGDTGSGEWMLGTNGDNPRFYSGSGINAEASTEIQDNAWHHLAAVRSGGAVLLYVNGIYADDDSSATGDLNTAKSLEIGCADTTENRYWKGKLSDIAIYLRALTPSEIQQLYADPWAMGRRRPTVVFVSGGGGSTIDATLGSVSVTGNSATISAGTTIQATLGTVSVSGNNSTVSAGATVNATLGTVVVSGNNTTISAGTTINAALGTVSVSGQNTTISAGTTVTATAGSIAVTGHNPTVSAGGTITATAGSVTVTAYGTTVSAGADIDAAVGSVSVASYAASISTGVDVDATLATAVVAGYPASISAGEAIAATIASVVVTSYAATVSTTDITTVSATVGAVVVTPFSVTVQVPTSSVLLVADYSVKAKRPDYRIASCLPNYRTPASPDYVAL